MRFSLPGPRTRRILFWTLVPLAIMVLAWQPLELQPAFGIDSSWKAGLEIATHTGIPFGTHLVFTYGPLGFLSVNQLWYHDLGELAFVYTVLLRLGLAAAVFLALRRSFGSLLAFLLAIVVASIDTQLAEMVVLLIVGVIALADDVQGRPAYALVAVSAAFAAFESLNKVSIGISLAVMTAVLVLTLSGPRLRYAAAALASFVSGVVVFWLAAGQTLGALPHYLSNSEQIVSGYSAAMEVSDPALAWGYAAAFLGLGLGLWGAWQMTDRVTTRRRAGVIALWVVFWFFAFKEGFVRQDSFHTAWFFGALLAGFVAFRWRREHRAAGFVALAALVVFALAAQSTSFGTAVNPTGSLRAAVDDLRSVTSSSRAQRTAAAGRAQIIASAPVDRHSLSLLYGHTVADYPLEIAVVWAYGLNWDPLPVEQAYSAYTTHLDNLDAGALASADAPQRLLIGPPESDIEGRVTSFDEPATSRSIICRYRPLATGAKYAVLGHASNRCSEPTLVATVHARWGQAVHVPPPPDAHSFVLARVTGAGSGPVEWLRGLLWKPAQRFVSINGGVAVPLVTGTAGDGLPLVAAPGIDLPPPFNVFPGATTIAVDNAGVPAGSDGSITYRFYAQSVS